MPAVQPGDLLAGFPVVSVSAQGQFIVVKTLDLYPVRNALAGLPGISYIEDNGLRSVSVIPNDSRYNEQYGPGLMGMPAAWGAVGYGSANVKVAVLDTGIQKTHADLTGSRMLQGWDYVNNDNNPNDDCGHGTHVSGTVGATTHNGIGVAGMSQASILHMKVLGPVGGLFTVTCSGSNSAIAQAIYDATDQGARVISMSLGGGGSDSTTSNAVNYAYTRNVLLVAAAGNDGASNSVDYPAAYPNVIAVAAITSTKARASYSDMGTQVEIAAPGSGVLSTYNDGSYRSLDGTSMATPHVAGALALALSCNPTITNTALRTALQNTAEDLGTAGRDTSFGYGLVRADLLVGQVCSGNPPPNQSPTASFVATPSALTVSVNAAASVDPDGTIASYAWNWGDGATSTGATASHTYATAGTYTIGLTVTDNQGATGTTSQVVTVTTGSSGGCATDPDPATGNLVDGQSTSLSPATGTWAIRKICVPSDATTLSVTMSGPSCGVLGCSFDADLYVRRSAAPTTSAYDCRPYQSGNAESCSFNPVNPGWFYVGVYAYSGSGTVTIVADHNGGNPPPPPNQPPTASFTKTPNGLSVSVNGAGSSDPDGTIASYAWTWGDGGTSTGVTASHTYAAAGTYTIGLTVTDNQGATASTSQSVTLTAPSDPDPSTPNLQSGQAQNVNLATGGEAFYKIQVPAGASQLVVQMTGPSCGVLGCSFDADLYTRMGARPTDSTYDCRPYQSGSTESCTVASPAAGWYYVRAKAYSGSGSVTLTATVS